MKIFCGIVALSAVSIDASTVQRSTVRRFGPANCVSVSRSSAGSCVLNTKCDGQDLSNFDISFQCVGESGRQMHAMGKGSFDQTEEYDTDMKCQECLPPPSSGDDAGVSLAAISVSRHAEEPPKADKAAEEAPPKAEWYGPESCVGVWKDDKSSTCVMQTDCDKDTQLNVYEFGLICIGQDSEMTRHLFGMGSFAHKETFSTLIKCDQCRALDEYMDGTKAVNVLTTVVKGMKDDLKGVSGDVVKLKAVVFPKAGPSPAPAGAAAAPASAKPKPAKFLVAPKEAPVPPPAPKQQEQSPPQPAVVMPVKHEEVVSVQQQDASLTTKDVVQHLKKKASQAAETAEPDGIGEILAAAVKGAQARGAVVMGTAQEVLSKAGYKTPLQPHVNTVATQVQHQVAAQQTQATPAQNIEYVEDASSPASKKDDDDEDADDDDTDGFR